jgi:NADP-dependent 3-hydroxy acid dehydrogenase YdfG
MTTWFITGASSGLGAALARAVLGHGDNAAITASNTGHVQGLAGEYPDSALPLRLDVTDHGQVVAAVSAATERFGAVDVLANNAGHGFGPRSRKRRRTRWASCSPRTSSAPST